MSEGERTSEEGEDVGRQKAIKKRNTFWPPAASLYGFGGKGGITGESVLIIFNQYALSNFLIQWTIPLFLQNCFLPFRILCLHFCDFPGCSAASCIDFATDILFCSDKFLFTLLLFAFRLWVGTNHVLQFRMWMYFMEDVLLLSLLCFQYITHPQICQYIF